MAPAAAEGALCSPAVLEGSEWGHDRILLFPAWTAALPAPCACRDQVSTDPVAAQGPLCCPAIMGVGEQDRAETSS